MMSNIPNCSLVIRCYNEEQHIGRLLAGVIEQTVRNTEIIVVDSGSTDATLSIANRYPVKIIHIRSGEFSFGRALNRGCAAATADLVVIASAHVYPVYKDWLQSLLAPFKDTDVAVVYGKQRGDENARFTEHQIYNKWFPDDSIYPQRHPFCNNANAAIRRSLWEKLPYDEELTGLEDLDWANKIMTQGKKVVYSAKAEIIHVHNETLKKVYNRYRREAIAFKNIYIHEHFNLKDFFKLFITNVFIDYFHACQDGVFFKNIFSIPAFRLMQFLGTYKGFRQSGCISERLRNRFFYPEGYNRKKRGIVKDDTLRRINYEHL